MAFDMSNGLFALVELLEEQVLNFLCKGCFV